mmetsp:Transcript_21636/g.68348  ORF Transcript_21636/g.68348 Transcript_21636/m.68348 type:complete len:202 (-) Transcript_21636:240-845(-)
MASRSQSVVPAAKVMALGSPTGPPTATAVSSSARPTASATSSSAWSRTWGTSCGTTAQCASWARTAPTPSGSSGTEPLQQFSQRRQRQRQRRRHSSASRRRRGASRRALRRSSTKRAVGAGCRWQPRLAVAPGSRAGEGGEVGAGECGSAGVCCPRILVKRSPLCFQVPRKSEQLSGAFCNLLWSSTWQLDDAPVQCPSVR